MSFFRDLGRMLKQGNTLENDAPAANIVMHQLENEQQLDNAFEQSMSKPVVLFKHSLTCPISGMVRRRILHLHEADDPPVYELVVQSSRSLSQKLEQALGIRHESPQVIVIHKQSPVYNTSHHQITVEDIRTAIAHATEAE